MSLWTITSFVLCVISVRSPNCKQEEGFLPEAIINFVAFLGWAPSNSTKELFTLEELLSEVLAGDTLSFF